MLNRYLQLPRAVHYLCLGTFINRAGTMMVPFLTLYIQEELGLGIQTATTAMGACGLGGMIAMLVGGSLADRLGRKIVLIISMIGGASVLMVFGRFQTSTGLILGCLIFATLMELYRPAVSAMIADLVEPLQRPHAYALLYVSVNLGFAVGPVMGGLLAKYSFQWLFWGDAATSIVYALIALLVIPETHPIKTGQATPTESADTNRFAAVRHILNNGVFLIYCLGCWCVGMVYHQPAITFPLHLKELGHTPSTYGFLIAINGLMIACFQLPLTHQIAHCHRVKALILSAIVSGIGFGVLGFSINLWVMALGIVIWTVGEMIQMPFISTIVADLSPVEYRARYMGVFSMSFASALMVGAPLGGWVFKQYGPNYLWGGSVFFCFIAAGLYGVIYRRVSGSSLHAPKA